MQIYYYFPLRFDYRSAQTIQVVQDYRGLVDFGYQTDLLGTYQSEQALAEIYGDLPKTGVKLFAERQSSKWRGTLQRWGMLGRMIGDRSPKVIISRNYNKMREVLFFRRFLGKARFLLERHEDALPHLLMKDAARAQKEKTKYAELLREIDGLILTNPSQIELFDREFLARPYTAVLPNGVETQTFASAERGTDPNRLVLTYAGQFTGWKNLPLLFQAMTHLDPRFVLRLAGGKDDEASRHYIEGLTSLYSLQGRVENLGFIPRQKLVPQVFSGSAALLLPLGDNLESRYFTSPMKLFEYMATSIPVVSVDYPSVRAICGDNTVFMASNDPTEFAKAIQQAIAEPAASPRLKRMQTLAETYSYANRSKRYHQYLQSFFQP